MNQLIKKLAKQACITIVSEPFDDASRSWNATMEKFAELIVKECALTAGLMEQQGRKNIGAQLLDNFGVKE